MVLWQHSSRIVCMCLLCVFKCYGGLDGEKSSNMNPCSQTHFLLIFKCLNYETEKSLQPAVQDLWLSVKPSFLLLGEIVHIWKSKSSASCGLWACFQRCLEVSGSERLHCRQVSANAGGTAHQRIEELWEIPQKNWSL